MFILDGERWKPSKVHVQHHAHPIHAPEIVPNATVSAVSPDGSTLYVGSSEGRYLWAFRRTAEGKTGLGDRYVRLWKPAAQKDQPVSALTFDSRGCIYAATPGGLQTFDPTGRLCGVIELPSKKSVQALIWTGTDLDVLAAQFEGGEFFTRKMNTRGIK